MALIQPRTPRDTSASHLAEQRIHEWACIWRRSAATRGRVNPGLARADSSLHCHFAGSWGKWCGGRPACGRTAQLGSPGSRDSRSHGRQVQVASRHAGSGRRVHIELDCGDFWQVARSAPGHALQYIVHLGQLVLLAAQHSSKVFVGRGAQFFLPVDRGFSVYLVAPMAMRIQRIREVRNCSESEARRYIRNTDQARQDLHQAPLQPRNRRPAFVRSGHQPRSHQPGSCRGTNRQPVSSTI